MRQLKLGRRELRAQNRNREVHIFLPSPLVIDVTTFLADKRKGEGSAQSDSAARQR